jgi:hypothetical protein
MRKITLLFLILALSLGFIKSALAAEPDLSNIYFLSSEVSAPSQTAKPQEPVVEPIKQVKTDLVLLNTVNHQITKAEAVAGIKYREFNNQFVFQIDKATFSSDATLELKELALGEQSAMSAPEGFEFASRIYEYNLTTATEVAFAQPFWFSVKYLKDDYFRKTMFYFDEQNKKWVGLESLISNGASKIVSKTNSAHAIVAILEDLNIMSEGTASWYKYKGCNCAASPDYPKGTKLKVTNVDNGKSVIVKVNDWGPDRSVHPTRVIDLDAVAFKQIAKTSAGLCKVKVELAEPVKSATK